MKIKVGINGMGRIGRMIVRSIIENNNKNIEIIAAMIGSANQPIVILPAIDHWTSFPPFNKPIPMTAPTTAWELETGTSGMEGKFIDCKKLLIPWEANKNKTIEWEITTIKAATGDIFNKSLPTVNITLFE